MTTSQKYSLTELIEGKAFLSVEKRLTKCPEQASFEQSANLLRFKTQCYPLHILCRQAGAKLSTFEAMIKAHPAALNSRDSVTRRYPLHVACWYGLQPEHVMTLVSAAPKILTERDIDGNTPLHLAAMYASPETVLALLSSNQVTSTLKNKRGQTALHCACLRRDISTDVLLAVLAAAPETSKVVDWQNRLALHDACQNLAGKKVLTILLEAYPEGCLICDKQSLTPYGILRVRFGVSARDARCQLIRQYIQNTSSCMIRTRNTIQFGIEDVRAIRLMPFRQARKHRVGVL